MNLLDKYGDLIKDFFQDDSLNNLKSQFKSPESNQNENNANINKHASNDLEKSNIIRNSDKLKSIESNESNAIPSEAKSNLIESNVNQQLIMGNSTSHGDDNKAYELNETNGGSVAKQGNLDLKYFIAMVVALILLIIGYKRNKNESK